MKKKLFLILLITCILFSVSSAFASDVNDTAIASDESDIGTLEVISNDENPVLTEEAFNKLQDVMEEAGELEKRAEYSDVVNNKYAKEAIK